MGLRFKILAALYIGVILYSTDKTAGTDASILNVFLALGGLLILSVLALWPNASRADRVDRAVDGSSWADRIEIEQIAEKRGRQQN